MESSRPDAGYYCGLTAGQSVLVTSHTNVAVDNVLKELVADDQKYGLGIMTPGTVIRQSGDDRKVLSNVRDHDFLLSDKTAAVKTNLDERLKALEEELEHNMAHPVRERESDLFDQLVGTGFDIKKVRQVRKTVSSRRELDQFANLDNTFVEIKADLAGTTEALSSLISKRQRLTDDVELISYEIDAAEARKQQAKLHEESSLARIFRFISRRRKNASLEASRVLFELLVDRHHPQTINPRFNRVLGLPQADTKDPALTALLK